MKTIAIAENDADRISARDESHFFDNKAKLISPAKLEKIAVAFANADGGEIFALALKTKRMKQM